MFGKGGGEGRENMRGKENEGEGRGGKIIFPFSCLRSEGGEGNPLLASFFPPNFEGKIWGKFYPLIPLPHFPSPSSQIAPISTFPPFSPPFFPSPHFTPFPNIGLVKEGRKISSLPPSFLLVFVRSSTLIGCLIS